MPDERWSQYDFDRAFTRLQKLGDALADRTLAQILIPFNIANIHWVLFLVDAVAQQIQYGDSLGWSIPEKDVNRLNRWLHQHGFQPFKTGPCLPHGKQLDTFSCSVAMVNIARHILFEDPLFDDSDKHFFRIKEYLNIITPISIPKLPNSHPNFEFILSTPQTTGSILIPEPDLEHVGDNTGSISQHKQSSSASHRAPSELIMQTNLKSVDHHRNAGGGPGLLQYFKKVSREEHLEAI